MLSKKEIAKKVKQVSEAENRINTLNKVIQSLYEDFVNNKKSTAFAMLSFCLICLILRRKRFRLRLRFRR